MSLGTGTPVVVVPPSPVSPQAIGGGGDIFGPPPGNGIPPGIEAPVLLNLLAATGAM